MEFKNSVTIEFNNNIFDINSFKIKVNGIDDEKSCNALGILLFALNSGALEKQFLIALYEDYNIKNYDLSQAVVEKWSQLKRKYEELENNRKQTGRLNYIKPSDVMPNILKKVQEG